MAERANNPIIPGFAPDPSVCLIDGIFFLVNSSFHLFPGLPIYTSKDLLSWTHIGHAISRRSQLSLRGATTTLHPGDNGNTILATGGLYAPTIRHHKGTTYILCTNVVHGARKPEQNFIIQTKDIYSGKWSDPVYYDFAGIDPSILFDDDGKIYVQGTLTKGFLLSNMEIDLQTGEMITPPKQIWSGWDQRFSEGPHIYKKYGWYYLLCAEGGTFNYHMLSVGRSRSIWGPFESCPHNPLWTADGTLDFVQHTGHGDFFQDTQSNWWVVMIGVRKTDNRYNMGRETFLTAVDWPQGGWPSIPSLSVDAVHSKTFNPVTRGSDGVDWVYLRDADLDRYEIGRDDVRVRASMIDLSCPDETTSFIGKRQRLMTGSATVNVSLKDIPAQWLRVGLVMYKDELRHLAIGYDFSTGQVFLHCTVKIPGYSKSLTKSVGETDEITFRLTYTEECYQFSFRESGSSSWQLLGEIDTIETSGFDFTGPIIGMFAVGNEVVVHFKDFQVDSLSSR